MTNSSLPDAVFVLADLPLGFRLLLAVLLALAALFGAAGNCIMCLLVWRGPALKSGINTLLAQIAAADFLRSVTVLPFTAVLLAMAEVPGPTPVCNAISSLQAALCTLAFLALLIISIDRYLLLARRKERLTLRRARVVSAVGWGVSLLTSAPPLLGWGALVTPPCWPHDSTHISSSDRAYLALHVTLTFLLPMTAMFITYAGIADATRRRGFRVMHHVTTRTHASPPPRPRRIKLLSLAHPLNVNVDMVHKTRNFKTIFLLFIVSLVFWTPVFILEITLAAGAKIPTAVVIFACAFALFSSAVYPLIYASRIRKFRDAIFELLPKGDSCLLRCALRAQRKIDPKALYECQMKEGPRRSLHLPYLSTQTQTSL